MNEQQRQEKIMEYQVLANQVQQLQTHLSTLEQHITQLNTLHHSLQQFHTINQPKEAFIPVGSGIFLRGRVDNTKEVLMNVGANVCVEKPTTEALLSIEKQLEEVKNVMQHFEEELRKGAERVEALRKELQPLSYAPRS